MGYAHTHRGRCPTPVKMAFAPSYGPGNSIPECAPHQQPRNLHTFTHLGAQAELLEITVAFDLFREVAFRGDDSGAGKPGKEGPSQSREYQETVQILCWETQGQVWGMRPSDISAAAIEAFKAVRIGEKAETATINHDLRVEVWEDAVLRIPPLWPTAN